ncbi:MAG: hypothetical protein VB070_15090 [Clostridiaceae bacterium]|nr:hypothetical protein [Clostridiaceae bacterium]
MHGIDIWLNQRPKWLRVAAKRYILCGEVDIDGEKPLTDLCISEASGNFPTIELNASLSHTALTSKNTLRLCSVNSIKGVNALAPKKGLSFGDGDLCVVYGNNGSGKSGYVRLLKHSCGARNPGLLYGDVFCAQNVAKEAIIEYEINGEKKSIHWTNGIEPDLHQVDIFDTSFENVFVGKEDEVCYEPEEFLFFRELIKICEKVQSQIDQMISSNQSKKPNLPVELSNTEVGKWYSTISKNTSDAEIIKHCSFDEPMQQELNQINRRLSEKSPQKKVEELTKKGSRTKELIKLIERLNRQLSDDSCKQLEQLFNLQKGEQDAAKTVAENIFKENNLNGIGTEIWKKLWFAAKAYSEQFAYVGMDFPNTSEDAVCVLCQQPLSKDASKRFSDFESFISGEIQKSADLATRTFRDAVALIEEIPKSEEIEMILDFIEADIAVKNEIADCLCAFRHRRNLIFDETWFIEKQDQKVCISSAILSLTAINEKFEDDCKKFSLDLEKDNTEELTNRRRELQAIEWSSQHKTDIVDEILYKRKADLLQEARKLTNTQAISNKMSELADELITAAFIERFNNEVKILGANRIRVTLSKEKVSKGKILHKLRLIGAEKSSLHDILSEGEKRIISIATFLADISGRDCVSTVIFDDPISSLDQVFEEAVVQRLCTLSQERQVIVFTHRLSLLGLLNDYADKVNVSPTIIGITAEPWGKGEPDLNPVIFSNPKKRLNDLINTELPKCRKIYEENGCSEYFIKAKGLCSDFRNMIERVIEKILLGDVIERYRRAINTKGKIDKLAKITLADCNLLDELMTKYSRYEHSQPNELHLELPLPDEFMNDFTFLKDWCDEFSKRT